MLLSHVKVKIKYCLPLCGILHKNTKFPTTQMGEEWVYRTATANTKLKKSSPTESKENQHK